MQMERLTTSDFDKMIIESIDEVYCFDKGTNDLLFFFDQIKSGEITSESDVVYAEGRQGVQLAAFDRNKTAGFKCENGYVQAGAIAVQLGSDLADGNTEYEIMETITVTKAGTTAAVSEAVSSLIGAYALNTDGSAGAKLSNIIVDTTDSTNKTLSGFTADAAKDVSYIVYYKATTATGKKIINAGDKFSKNIKLVINFVAQEPCSGDKYLMQCIMPNAKASGSFSLSAGDDPAVHSFEASALYDACSADKELFTITMV